MNVIRNISIFSMLVFIIFSNIACSGKNSVPKSFNPVFIPQSSVHIVKFKDNKWITVKDLKFEFGKTPNRISLTVPAGFITDTTSMPVLRGKKILNNSSILHDYLFWVQPCDKDNGRKIANKIMKQTLKMNLPGKVIPWSMKKGVQGATLIQRKEDSWSDNKKLKESGHTRFATKYIKEKYWKEISKFTWENFRTKYDLKPVKNDIVITDPKICCVFPKWCNK